MFVKEMMSLRYGIVLICCAEPDVTFLIQLPQKVARLSGMSLPRQIGLVGEANVFTIKHEF